MVYYGPPPESLVAANEALADPATHRYGPVTGQPVLVQKITRKLQNDNGILVGPENVVVVTAGSNLAFYQALLAIADTGDEIVLLRPYYFNHEMAVRMANCVPVLVDVDANYQLDPARILSAITKKTRAIVTISPNNPTGAVYSRDRLVEINRICSMRDIYHIHDEAYEYFTYDGAEHYSPASALDTVRHTISLFSLSKSYGFAGWRIGYMVAPAHLMPALRKIQDTTLICPPIISQVAAVAALRVGRDYVRKQMEPIAAARTAFVEALSLSMGRENIGPVDGAFYLYLSLPSGYSPMKVTEQLIKEFGIAVIPGDTFGVEDRCTLRVSYGSMTGESLDEGLQRLVKGLQKIWS